MRLIKYNQLLALVNRQARGSELKLRSFGSVILVLIAGYLTAQDPVFSQFYLSPLQLNPGLSGLTESPRFSANYRNQFPGFNNAYRTYAVSYDQFFPSINSGAGLWILGLDSMMICL